MKSVDLISPFRLRQTRSRREMNSITVLRRRSESRRTRPERFSENSTLSSFNLSTVLQ